MADDVETETRAPYNTYRDGKVHVSETKCTTCIFWPGNRMRLRPGQLKELVDAARADDGYIVCHSTLPPADQAVCRGWWDSYRQDSWLMRLAQALSIVEYVPAKEL